MSSIASLFNVPKTQTEVNEWSFAHMAHHRDIIRTIYELGAIALPEYSLDPINPADTANWERLHQTMHDQMNSVLGIAGFNLLGLNWQDENNLAAWIQLNSIEHREVSDFLVMG